MIIKFSSKITFNPWYNTFHVVKITKINYEINEWSLKKPSSTIFTERVLDWILITSKYLKYLRENIKSRISRNIFLTPKLKPNVTL